jgi:hypothetical protein
MGANSLNHRIEYVEAFPRLKPFATVISAGAIVMQTSKSAGHVAPMLHRDDI